MKILVTCPKSHMRIFDVHGQTPIQQVRSVPSRPEGHTRRTAHLLAAVVVQRPGVFQQRSQTEPVLVAVRTPVDGEFVRGGPIAGVLQDKVALRQHRLHRVERVGIAPSVAIFTQVVIVTYQTGVTGSREVLLAARVAVDVCGESGVGC